MLECKGLQKSFGALKAVQDLSFAVSAGEILGVTGPNGAGKTTLLEVISGFTPADAGSVLFNGQDITRFTPEQCCHVGICRFFQQNTAFDSMTVFDNVAVGALFGKTTGLSRGQVKQRVEEALVAVHLENRRDAIAATLSVFERKSLMLASSIVTQPGLLLLDEPVSGLNPEEMDRMADLVLSLNQRGVALILIEHVMRFMFKLAPRILVMHQGAKVFDGPAAQMVADSTVQSLYLGERAAKRMTQEIQAMKVPI